MMNSVAPTKLDKEVENLRNGAKFFSIEGREAYLFGTLVHSNSTLHVTFKLESLTSFQKFRCGDDDKLMTTTSSHSILMSSRLKSD